MAVVHIKSSAVLNSVPKTNRGDLIPFLDNPLCVRHAEPTLPKNHQGTL